MNPIEAWLVGTMIDGRYLVEAPIARGGMSTVFRATDRRLGRQVAVKVMHSEFAADPAFLSRFEFEARAVAGLKDPGLVAVYDQGVDGDHAFLVMELVRGGTLRELLRERGPMPPHAAAAVTRPALTALAAAHRGGLVHRDVKPENVLISDDGDVKLADFGLVRAVAGTSATSGSVMLGTAAYLSPEQVGDGRADARSDVYAVGVLLFEMLTGRIPFSGDTNVAIAYRRLEQDVPAPSSVITGVPREFDDFVLQATRRGPDERFRDAGEMGAALDAVAGRLRLPRFRIPAPRNSAQHRSMAVAPPSPRHGSEEAPTTVTGADSVPEDETAAIAPSAADSAGTADAAPTATRHYTVAAPLDDAHGAPPAAGGADDATPAPGGDLRAAPHVVRQRRRSRRSAVVWGVVVAVLAILLGVAGWWFGSGRLTTVPSISGMDRGGVVAALNNADLTPQVHGMYSDDDPADTVLSIDPGPGTRITRSSNVEVRVSLGRPTIPDLDGDPTVDAVLDRLHGRTLTPRRGSDRFSTTVDEGHVMRLDPPPGTAVSVGSTVTITASKGPPPVDVPDVAGQSVEDAKTALASAHLDVDGQTTAFDPDVDGGKVSGTAPDAAATVPAGSSVTLVVSDAITVPDVTGASPPDARSALADAGIEMVDGGTTSDTDQQAGTVGETDPAAGERVDPDHAKVTVYISDTVPVPGLIGKSVGTARSALVDRDLGIRVRQLIGGDSSIVVSQSPSSGAHAHPGETVTVTAIP